MKVFPTHGGGLARKNVSPDLSQTQFNPLLFGASLIFHLLLFVAFFFIQTLSPPSVELPMVKVNLVSLNSVDVGQDAPSVDQVDSPKNSVEKTLPDPMPVETVLPEPEKAIVPVDETVIHETSRVAPVTSEPDPVMEVPVKIPMVEKKAVLRKKEISPSSEPLPVKPVVPEQKVSLKKKTFRPENVLANAKKQIAQSVEKQDENSLDTALTRLRKKVATQSSTRGGLFGAQGGQVTGDGKNARAIDLYNLELMYRIQQNWAFNRQLAGGNDGMEVRILIKILKSGQIRDVWFETRSGNRLLDESALKAVKKSNPLSPLPRGYNSYDVGLIFTPSGLM